MSLLEMVAKTKTQPCFSVADVFAFQVEALTVCTAKSQAAIAAPLPKLMPLSFSGSIMADSAASQ